MVDKNDAVSEALRHLNTIRDVYASNEANKARITLLEQELEEEKHKVTVLTAAINQVIAPFRGDFQGGGGEDERSMSSTEHAHHTPAFVCPDCDRAFAKFAGLRTHERVHRARPIKEFQCPLCPRSYTTKNSLKRHMILNHEQDD
jgi:hypothetical protein